MTPSDPLGTVAPDADATGRARPAPRTRAVLIGGCPRSGTTLLGAMLGRGPDVVTVPEAEFKWGLLPAAATAGETRIDRAAATRYLAREWRFRLWDVPLDDLAGLPDQTPYGVFLDRLVTAHGRAVGKPSAATWVDHTPLNIKYARTLARLLPEARFVHLVRDGRGVAASVLPLDWGPSTVREAARWWATHVAMGLAAAAALGPGVVHTVRYEDLVREGADTLRDLCDALDLPFDDDMLSTRDYRVPRYTRGQHGLVARPPDPARADGWRGQLARRQVEEFEHVTGELLDYLGYPLEHGLSARPPRRRERLGDALQGPLRRQLLDRPRRLRRRARVVLDGGRREPR